MIVKTKGKILKRNHIWFDNISKLSELKAEDMNCDEIIIHGNKTTFSGRNIDIEPQNSLITDLTLDDEDLIKQFSKTVRNEINRSRKDGVKCMVYTSEDVLENEQIISSFESLYISMYHEKGMEGMHLDLGEIKGYCLNKSFILTGAQIDEKTIVYHSYIFNDVQCRLLHSCSEFRIEDNVMRNAIGRANKYLHWEDMLLFKDRGIVTYDWGGISSLEEPNGIDKFKMSFGGKPIAYYNIHIACSLTQKLLGKIQ